jgi:hypothetical protein
LNLPLFVHLNVPCLSCPTMPSNNITLSKTSPFLP